jgi:pimeloyl-ACP methyl ester carboxylesterase
VRNPLAVLILSLAVVSPATSQTEPQPPGRLIDLGGYRLHLWCTGTSIPDRPTVVLSPGGGDFATDWSLVQRSLGDSVRVCSYDRPGYGWSDPGPYPRTLRQEAFEIRSALERAGELPPFVLVGHSIGAFVVRSLAETHRGDVVGMVLVDPANENGKLGYRGQWTIPRLLATDRPVPPFHSFADNPARSLPGEESDSCRARAERSARIWRPYDRLPAQAQRYRVWALQHPSCTTGQDDYFAEEMARFFGAWSADPHPLDSLPLIVVLGTQRARPPGLSEAEWRSDSLRIDLSKLSRRGRLVSDTLSGHHVQLDNPGLVVTLVRDVLHQVRE